MDREKIEKTLEILRCYDDLLNISIELENRIPKKHHEIINDLISEIEHIANLLIWLENDLYYEYLRQ